MKNPFSNLWKSIVEFWVSPDPVEEVRIKELKIKKYCQSLNDEELDKLVSQSRLSFQQEDMWFIKINGINYHPLRVWQQAEAEQDRRKEKLKNIHNRP